MWCPKLDTGGLLFPVQWLGLYALSEGGLGLIPGQGTRSHMLQLKIPPATTKTQHSKKNKKKKEPSHIILLNQI